MSAVLVRIVIPSRGAEHVRRLSCGRCSQGRYASLMSRRVCGKKARRMASFNKVILLGNLTRDPELRFTPSGTPMASFGLAVNTPRAGQSSPEPGGQGSLTERREDVCFVDVVAFGRQAETASEYLSKGRAALIEGRLQWRSWDGQD